MDSIIMLGTGNATVLDCYNTCFAMKDKEEYFLVDTGGGNRILKQLQLRNISLTHIHTMFITHAHTDHIMGAIWLYRMIATSMNKQEYTGNLTIYCHDEVKYALETMLSLMLSIKLLRLLDCRIFIKEVKDKQEVEIMNTKTVFFDIASTKIKQFGFYMELPKGRFVCLGDEPCSEAIEPIVENAYFVMHEAFCLYEERDIFKPYEKYHSTVQDASKLAQRCHIENLLLYHTEETHLNQRKKLYTEKAAEYFAGKIYVPDDLEEILL